MSFLIDQGWIHAERRVLHGAVDKGDLTGIPGVCVEIKDHKTITLAQFLDEALLEKKNSGAKIGVAWIKRIRKGSPGDWYVVMDGHQFVEILKDLGY